MKEKIKIFFDKLSDQEKLEIAKKYKEKKISLISFGKENDLNLRGRSFRQLLGVFKCGSLCEECGGENLGKLSYINSDSIIERQSIKCSKCNHQPFYQFYYFEENLNSTDICECETCQKLLKEKKEQKRKELEIEKRKKAERIEELKKELKMCWETGSIHLILGFCSLLHLSDENYQNILPLSLSSKPLMANEMASQELLNALWQESVIIATVSKESENVFLNENIYFKEIGNKNPIKLLCNMIEIWIQNSLQEEEKTQLFYLTISKIFLQLQLDEVIGYLLFLDKQYDLQRKIGLKTINIIEEFLPFTSPSEIFSKIWSAQKSACAFASREGLSSYHQSNLVISYLKTSLENPKYISEYNRPKNLPRSIYSELFSKILGLEKDNIYMNWLNFMKFIKNKYRVKNKFEIVLYNKEINEKIKDFEWKLKSQTMTTQEQKALLKETSTLR